MTKILLVEDDKNLREIYSVRLSAEGYQVISSGNGEEALAAAVGEKPDLIISDVMMPKISGFEMLDLLKSNDTTKDIPVIMLTALSSETQRDRGDNLGADRYLVKSQVGLEDIIRTVHEVLVEYGVEKQPGTDTRSSSAGAPLPNDNSGLSTLNASNMAVTDQNMATSNVPNANQQAAANQPVQSTISEPIINNPSILGTNFASVADATPTPFDIGNTNVTDNGDSASVATNVEASAAPSASELSNAKPAAQNVLSTATVASQVGASVPGAGQSAFNPSSATHPAIAAGVPTPQMPDTPMRVPMPVGNNQPPVAAIQPAAQAMGQTAMPNAQGANQPIVQQPALEASTSASNAQVVGAERTIQPVERRTPRIDIDSLLNGAS